jgi:hypothetical protein
MAQPNFYTQGVGICVFNYYDYCQFYLSMHEVQS